MGGRNVLSFRFYFFPFFSSGAVGRAKNIPFPFLFFHFQDDCCDRSEVESEVSTLHSQDDMTSEHKEGISNDSAMSADEAGISKGSLLHRTSEPSLVPANGRGCHGGRFHVSFSRPTLHVTFGIFVQQNASARLSSLADIFMYYFQESYNLQRFRHGHLPDDGTNRLQMPQDDTFNPWDQEYFDDRGREDDWSNR
jgi:hypothetical protein